MVIIMDMESGERLTGLAAQVYTDEVLLAEWTEVPSQARPQLVEAVAESRRSPVVDADFLSRAYRAQR